MWNTMYDYTVYSRNLSYQLIYTIWCNHVEQFCNTFYTKSTMCMFLSTQYQRGADSTLLFISCCVWHAGRDQISSRSSQNQMVPPSGRNVVLQHIQFFFKCPEFHQLYTVCNINQCPYDSIQYINTLTSYARNWCIMCSSVEHFSICFPRSFFS